MPELENTSQSLFQSGVAFDITIQAYIIVYRFQKKF